MTGEPATSHDPEIIDARLVRRYRDEEAFASLPVVGSFGVLVYGLYSLSHALVLPEDVAAWMTPLSAITALTCGVVAVVARSRLVAVERADLLAGTIAVAALTNVAVHYFLLPLSHHAINFVLFNVAAGGMLHSRAWIAGLLTVSTLAWLAVSVNGGGAEHLERGFGIAASVLFALAFMLVRRNHRERAYSAEILRIRRDKELARRSAQRDAVVETALDSVITMNTRGEVVDFNPAAEVTFGYDRANALGRSLAEMIIPPELRASHSRGLARFLATGEGPVVGKRIEIEALRADGKRFPVELSVNVAGNGDDRLFVGYIRDISERVRTRGELREAKERAESASLEKSRFVANMSHEIRTPLNAVIGLGRLLAETDLNEEQREYVEAVNLSSGSLYELIGDVLDFSRIDAGEFDVEDGPMDLGELVEEVAAAARDTARTKGIELVSYVDPMLPAEVLGDRRRLRQVLNNLVGNAVKFTRDGWVQLGVELCSGSTDQTVTVRLVVSDSGVGIREDQRLRVFERFAQVEEDQTGRAPGTGLGLAISRALVEAMGGHLELQSTPNVGSSFSVDLDLKRSPRKEPRLDCSRGDGRRVVIVHQSPAVRRALVFMLERAGFQAESYQDGYQGIVRIAEGGRPPVAVLIDSSQDDPGPEALESILAHRIGRSPPVVRIGDFFDRGGRSGCDLASPVRLRPLLRTVARAAGDPVPDLDDGNDPLSLSPTTEAPLDLLLVEDNALNGLLFCRILEQAGHVVTWKKDGADGVRAATSHRFDVVLMDIEMPRMSGFEVTKRIREFERENGLGAVPIVALTAHAMRGFREQCLAAGMTDYLVKPVETKEQLLGMCRRWAPARPVGVPGHTAHGGNAGPAGDLENESSTATAAGASSIIAPSLAALAPQFLKTITRSASSCALACERNDFLKPMRFGHQLKGSGGTFGFPDLTELGSALEDSAKAGDATACRELLDRITDLVERLTSGDPP